MVEGKFIAAGNEALLRDLNIEPIPPTAESLRNGETPIYVAIDAQFAGWISVGDPLKWRLPSLINDLMSEGLRIVMLTGDRRSVAETVARRNSRSKSARVDRSPRAGFP